MTTIAWDGEVLAADTLCTDSYGMMGYMSKLKELEDGSIIAHAGSSSALNTFADWHLAWNRDPTKWPKSLKSSSIIVISNGLIMGYEGERYPTEYLYSQPVAWGSGALAALALMAKGYDAVEAVKGASKVDIYTGGDVEHYLIR